jgi:hypothetical protein
MLHIRENERGQTAVGGVYGAVFAVLVVGAVGTAGYAYIASPAVSPADSTPEASVVATDLVHDELTIETDTSATTGAPRIDPDKVESFFNDTNAQAARDHYKVTENNLNVNVTLENSADLGPESVFGGSQKLSAGDSNVPSTVSGYQQPAVLNGEVVTVVVRTWPE